MKEEREVRTPQIGIWPSAKLVEFGAGEAAAAVIGVEGRVLVGVVGDVVELTMSVASVKVIIFVDVTMRGVA